MDEVIDPIITSVTVSLDVHSFGFNSHTDVLLR